MFAENESGPLSGLLKGRKSRRVRTPTVLQMESVECGAAALSCILGYHGRFVPLEELRVACGVSRDGSKASNIVKAARQYGMLARGHRKEPENLGDLPLPFIVFWNFNHFVVVEGFSKGTVYLNDPATGPRRVSYQEFDAAFTGVALTFEPGPNFVKEDRRRSLFAGLWPRLVGAEPGVAYVLLTALGLVFTGLVIPSFSRVFVDDVLIGGRDWIIPLLVGMGLTAILRACFAWLQQIFLLRLETRLAVTMASRFLRHVLCLPVEFFNQRLGGEIGWRVSLNDRVACLLSGDLAATTLNVLLVMFYVVLMLQYDVPLTLLGVLIALVNIIVLRVVSRRRSDTSQRVLQEQGKLLGTTYNGLQMIDTLKASGAESDYFERWAGYQARTLYAQQQLALSNQFLSIVPTLLSGLNVAAVLALGSLRVMSGEITIGMLVAFQSLMVSFLSPVNQLVEFGGVIQEAEGDLNRLEDVLHHKVEPHSAWEVENTTPGLGEAKLSGQLDIKCLTFGYNRLARPLVEEFNLSLKPGARVALVGRTGSGKSTLARLVAGLYRPWNGDILFDGKPRSEIPHSVIVNSLAMVDQNIVLFEGSIRDNLTLWDSTVPESDVIQAAKDAAIHSDVVERAGAYDALVLEGGRNFSGGQRQRLEIARALVNNPAILLLDEAASALDALTEEIIDENLRRRGCTCLIVAHRLSTIRDCDEIIVLEDGRIVQRGTHNEMIQVDGPYRRLLSSQEFDTSRTQLESILESL